MSKSAATTDMPDDAGTRHGHAEARPDDAADAANAAAMIARSGEAVGNDPMQQVRDLLFGQAQRETGERQQRLDARLDGVEAQLVARIAALEDELAEARETAERRREASVRAIGERIAEIGQAIIASAGDAAMPGGEDAARKRPRD